MALCIVADREPFPRIQLRFWSNATIRGLVSRYRCDAITTTRVHLYSHTNAETQKQRASATIKREEFCLTAFCFSRLLSRSRLFRGT